MRNRFLPTLENRVRLSFAGFLVFSPISILAVPVTVLVANPQGPFLILLLAGFLITIIISPIYSLFILLDRKIQEPSQTLRLATFLLSSVVTGGIRGLILFEIVSYLDLRESGTLSNRIFASIITTLIWLSAANLLINYSRDFRGRYQKTLAIYIQRNFNGSEAIAPSSQSKFDLELVQKNLNEMVSVILAKKSDDNLKTLADEIRGKINEELRPLSQRIWLKSLNEYPVFRYTQMFRDSISLLDFSRVLYLAILAALALFNNALIRSALESFLRTTSFLLVQIFMITLYKNRGKIHNILFLIAIGFLPVMVSEYLVELAGYEGSWLATFIIAPVAPAILIVLSLFRLTLRDHTLLIELLNAANSRQSATSAHVTAIGERHLASFIHNSLQSELLAIAGQLEEAAMSNNYEESTRLLQRVNSLVNRSFIDEFAKFSESPLERLNVIRKSWAGILEIEVDISEEFLNIPQRNAIIVQIIEEFAANSFRHGRATTISVTASIGRSGLALRLMSNGSGLTSTRKGLGSQWLDQIALTGWDLVETSEGIALQIEI